ncbi:unnamed protein product [Linum tenue]|uniref:Uncharacterized protein n=1 Tax=Linum tenue TaxID=586396 RepID=A0AAV0JDB4_9ROSI|nr:unnamed protein product [Linum tenue]
MDTRKKNEAQSKATKKFPAGVLGANAMIEGASSFIGSIVEKGISENELIKPLRPIPPPSPTVLPFPVARHRAHGPYWNAMTSKKGGNGKGRNDEEGGGGEEEEDNDPTDYNPISALANPVERKEKKGLDVSRWKELARESSPDEGKVQENRFRYKGTKKLKKDGKGGGNVNSKSAVGNEAPVEVDLVPVRSSSVPATEVDEPSLSGEVDFTGEQPPRVKKRNPVISEKLRKQEQGTSNGAPSSILNDTGVAQRSMSLESEIDVENRARLQNMSSGEIAEAQAEIMEKMNPSLLNLLKKRGQQKLKQQNVSDLDVAIKSQSANGSSIKDSSAHSRVANDRPNHNRNNENPETPSGTTSWNAWSDRVEAARGVRFSYEGNVIPADFETGNIPNDAGQADSLAERDYLRTDGDPGAAGYSIKEAVQLTRSVIPGQRGLALNLLASVLNKAIHNIRQKEVGSTASSAEQVDKLTIDWEAIWAYALGPEPELVFALRICLDDNHSSVVLACARVIQCVLSYDLNESFFQTSEKIGTYDKDLFTAPVFRSKPEIDGGCLHGGFWKYSAKPYNLKAYAEEMMDDGNEEEPTLKDDIFVAGQDVAAGLVRMDIIPRMRYLLEANPTDALEECIMSILVALARHSPTCAAIIMNCQGLVRTVVERFGMDSTMNIRPSKIKSIRLMKVLAQSEKKNCLHFINDGSFSAMTRYLYWYTSSLDEWVKSGKENCELSSALKVEQLQFWKVCINYGFCISDFPDIFPALCFWLNPSSFEKLVEKNVVSEFASIAKEAYLVLEALARKLPNFYSQKQQPHSGSSDEHESWSWNYVTPVVDLALKWMKSKTDPCISELFESAKGVKAETDFQDSSLSSLLSVYSAVMHMLCTLLLRVKPDNTRSPEYNIRHVPWLPEFVPKVGLELIQNGFLGQEENVGGISSFVMELCRLRQQNQEISLASVSCLNAILLLVRSIDALIQSAKSRIDQPTSQGHSSSREGKLLEEGMLKTSMIELRYLLDTFTKFVAQEWELVQSVEVFGRGGTAPGVGLGWGASGGGFWSLAVLLAQADAKLLINLLEVVSSIDLVADREMTSTAHRINSVLRVCLTVGPRDTDTAEKAINTLLQVQVLKYLNVCTQRSFQSNKGGTRSLLWQYTEEEYQRFSKTLSSHFRSRWLSEKKKSKPLDGNKSTSKRASLETIHEEDIGTSTSFTIEWARQRLPLPMHWFLSPISEKKESTDDALEVVKSGLFFLLSLEAMCSLLPNDAKCPVRDTPLAWKLHSLSAALLFRMDVLDDDRSKDIFEVLQNLYGQVLDESRKDTPVESLRFKSEIVDIYTTFLEALVDKFASDSYGDIIFGRQIAIYLHRCTETPVRLAAWTVLSNARVLEILPPLDKCVGRPEGYLEPVENNEAVLQGYVKSWVSGALDRSATRGSMAFTLVLHHLSSLIFLPCAEDRIVLRNKLAQSLIRDYSQKPKHEVMMLELIQYNFPSTSPSPERPDDDQNDECSRMAKRFEVLAEACDSNSSLLSEVEKLKSAFAMKRIMPSS